MSSQGSIGSPLLLASATGNEGGAGGVFAVGTAGCELLDPVPTSGMAIAPDGSRLARLSWVVGRSELTELIVSDQHGLLCYRRLDEVGEPHSMLWSARGLYAVSTHTNSVVEMDETGRSAATLRPRGAPALGDCWHLNSLTEHEGRLLVSAFGMFATVRGWSEPGALKGAGIVLDAMRGDVVLAGLDAPHDPTWVGDGWIICNSLTREVVRLDARGRRIASIELGGWTRGLLVDADVVYVGVSAHRLTPAAERAYIAVLDLTSLSQLERLELPTRDVFALCRHDVDIAQGLQVGARRGAIRALGSPAVSMDTPLHEADSVATVDVVDVSADLIRVIVTNRSGVLMSSLGRHPVRVGVRAHDDGRLIDVVRNDLASPLYPHGSVGVDLPLPPMASGRRVRISLLQEMVRWFDDVSDESAVDVVVPSSQGPHDDRSRP